MLTELFKAICEQAVFAAGPRVTKPSGEPGHVYFLNGARMVAEPAPRSHTVSDIDAIVNFAERFAGTEGTPSVWYHREAVTCLLDDGTRRDVVTFPLKFSPQLQALSTCYGKRFTQKELIFFLRSTMKACLGTCPGLIDCLRRLKFENGSVVDTAVEHGKVSLGRSITDRVTGVSSIPEYVVLDVPIFESGFPFLHFPVECALEPDATNGTFQMVPVAGEIEKAISLAEKDIGEGLIGSLAEKDVPVYFGKP